MLYVLLLKCGGIHLEKLLKYGILQPIDEQKETSI